VNNAAISPSIALPDLTSDIWDRVFAINVRAPFLAMRELISALSGGGAVVNISSVHAVSTSSRMTAYASSKAALLGLTRAAALELAPHGVRVNAVLPGAVESQMLEGGLKRNGDPQVGRATLIERTPLGRIGDPAQIAEAVFFLADSKLSGFVTGQILVVDGGATARLSTE
jgi:NAD(P)-dependent dehydrogenase (short-subunit alcohol dehydrogenase family)